MAGHARTAVTRYVFMTLNPIADVVCVPEDEPLIGSLSIGMTLSTMRWWPRSGMSSHLWRVGSAGQHIIRFRMNGIPASKSRHSDSQSLMIQVHRRCIGQRGARALIYPVYGRLSCASSSRRPFQAHTMGQAPHIAGGAIELHIWDE